MLAKIPGQNSGNSGTYLHHPKFKVLKAKAQILKNPHAVPTEARCLYLKRMHAMAGMQWEVIQKWPSAYDHLAAGTLCVSMNTGRFEVRGLCLFRVVSGGSGKENGNYCILQGLGFKAKCILGEFDLIRVGYLDEGSYRRKIRYRIVTRAG